MADIAAQGEGFGAPPARRWRPDLPRFRALYAAAAGALAAEGDRHILWLPMYRPSQSKDV